MATLLKDPTTGPLVSDLNQYDVFLWDWENLSESILEVLDNPPGDPYRNAVEYKRAEIKDLCRRMLDAMARTEPRTILFALPGNEERN